MTIHECTANLTNLKNTSYFYPISTSSKPHHIAEDSDEYNAVEKIDDTLAQTLQQERIRALSITASGQIGRLYKLANMLIETDRISSSEEDLEKIGLEVRNAASIIEDSLYAILSPIIDEAE